MTAPYDDTEFIDRDLLESQAEEEAAAAVAPPPAVRQRSRQELEGRLGETQNRLVELRRLQDQLERERSEMEETRRRRVECETGREEMLTHLTRGIGLLEKAEFEARRQAEQMSRTLAGFRESLAAVEAIREESWTDENLNSELSRALTAIENARMEWSSARLKWDVLNDKTGKDADAHETTGGKAQGLGDLSFGQLCRVGLAVSLPVAIVALAGVVLLAIQMFQP
jgi:chromosome segregation ATPase